MNQLTPNTEALTFKIGLSGTFWDKRPAFSIWVNDVMYASDCIEDHSIKYVTFSAELEENQQHQLKIRLENKTDSDTIVDHDTIVKDMLLNIDSIEIDDIEIGTIKWSESKFIPDDVQARSVLLNCVNLGWNGTYTLSFESPYYLWLLEKL